MSARLSEPDYQLVWPRSLFVAEASKLLNMRVQPEWSDRCELLLSDAFVSDYVGGPVADFQTIRRAATDPWGARPTVPTSMTDEQKFLRDLMVNADALHEDPPPKRPYWKDRTRATSSGETARQSLAVTVRKFVALANELDEARFFDMRFGEDCVDGHRGAQAVDLIERELGEKATWPLTAETLAVDVDLFYSIVEFLHDNVARPSKPSYYHDFAECGWHREEFDLNTGRAIYRWRVNKILDRSATGLRLAEAGEDVGRLVTATDDARTDLALAVANRPNEEPTTDQVRHALALFRERGADRNQKRSAVAVLALVLEERRRDVLPKAMAKSDSGALFTIANQFNIRHQRADQKRDYDDFYLDWIFWVYLASIELTNRVIDEQ